MGCLGVHFSLSEDEVLEIHRRPECERPDHVHEVLEEEYYAEHPERIAESDKAWDAMHRVLADGRLSWDGGEYPLNHVVLGGELLYTDSNFIMVVKTPQQVQDVATALRSITAPDFRRRYYAIDSKSYGMQLTEEDLGYTWQWFKTVRNFWLRAAEEGRYVLFTADQ
jgi:hypothetical protein